MQLSSSTMSADNECNRKFLINFWTSNIVKKRIDDIRRYRKKISCKFVVTFAKEFDFRRFETCTSNGTVRESKWHAENRPIIYWCLSKIWLYHRYHYTNFIVVMCGQRLYPTAVSLWIASMRSFMLCGSFYIPIRVV